MEGKKVIVGVTGGIAAYKAADVVRGLQRKGFDVWVVMTEASLRFITPLTFEALTNHPVCIDIFENDLSPYPHITITDQASAMVVVPCTANTLAKIAHGFADNMLTSAVLAMDGKLIIVPAMNARMYMNKAMQENLDTLRNRGVQIIEPIEGILACGEEGIGKLPDPETIIAAVCEALS